MKAAPHACPWPAQAPFIELRELRQLPSEGPGFLSLVRRELVAHYEDGSQSAPFVYDQVERAALDAVVICAHFVADGARYVYLRSALRPPLAFRADEGVGVRKLPHTRTLWELPAGLIEVDEVGPARIQSSAARELEEELGFRVPAAAFRPLGSATLPCPAVIAERQYFVEVAVDPTAQGLPTLDGSPLEHGGKVTCLKLAEALAMWRTGDVDAKTELGLRRLAERHGC